MPTSPGRAFWLILALPLLLQIGCASRSVHYSPGVPPLPQEARQPETPAACSPSCLERLRLDFESLRGSLMSAEPPEKPASGPIRP